MMKHNVWNMVPRDEDLEGAKMVSSTWAMKKKSNGTYHARLNERRFEKVPGEHYDASSIAAPVTNDAIM